MYYKLLVELSRLCPCTVLNERTILNLITIELKKYEVLIYKSINRTISLKTNFLFQRRSSCLGLY